MGPCSENSCPIELGNTTNLMLSMDYKDRFVAEYQQLVIRKDKLANMIMRAESGLLDFKPDTPIWMLKQQLNMMEGYAVILQLRAELENIDIKN